MKRICQICGRIFDGDPAALKCPECVKAQTRTTLRERTCNTCSKTFFGGPGARYCPDCRAARQRAQSRECKARRRTGNVRAIGSTDFCVICGKPYVVMSGLQKYCPDCAPQAYREIDREQSRAWNKSHTTPESRREKRYAATAPLVCAVCGKTFIPQPGRANATTCSKVCSSRLSAQRASKWENAHRKERNEYQNQRLKAHKAAMSQEEYAQYRAKINQRARENYRKRKKQANDANN